MQCTNRCVAAARQSAQRGCARCTDKLTENSVASPVPISAVIPRVDPGRGRVHALKGAFASLAWCAGRKRLRQMGWAEMKWFKCRETNQWETAKKGGRGFDQKICPRVVDCNLSWERAGQGWRRYPIQYVPQILGESSYRCALVCSFLL